MWLPTPIYERVPQFWLLLGLLFMSSGAYLGFDYSLSFVYFGVGAVCVVWSLVIFIKRSRYRNNPVRKPIPTFKSDEQFEHEEELARTAILERQALLAKQAEEKEPPVSQPG